MDATEGGHQGHKGSCYSKPKKNNCNHLPEGDGGSPNSGSGEEGNDSSSLLEEVHDDASKKQKQKTKKSKKKSSAGKVPASRGRGIRALPCLVMKKTPLSDDDDDDESASSAIYPPAASNARGDNSQFQTCDGNPVQTHGRGNIKAP